MKLLEKLNAITQEIGSLTKGGSNKAHNYQYVKGEDAMSTFRLLEVKHRIKVIPVIQSATLKVDKLEKGSLTTAVIDYNIYDLDSDQMLTVSIPTQGYDSTDKSAFKLMTGGFKYFLLQTFSASTDDPEKDDGKNYGAKTTKTTPDKVEETPATNSNRFKTKSSGFSKKTAAPKSEFDVEEIEREAKAEQEVVKTEPAEKPKSRFSSKLSTSTPVTKTPPVIPSNGVGAKFKSAKFSNYMKKEA